MSERRLPVFDLRVPATGTAVERRAFDAALRAACRDLGAFYLVHHGIAAPRMDAALDAAARFFDLADVAKARVGIERSAHFRGYSRLANARDFREQMHFGCERDAARDVPGGPQRLVGPNQWPLELGADWRESMLDFMAAVGAVGERLLAVLAAVFELPGPQGTQGDPYRLMKLLRYHPPAVAAFARQGVAPHCDWSWLTLIAQREPGLTVRTRDGEWCDAPPLAGSLVVNIGELLALVSGGTCHAVPHQVRHAGGSAPRDSIPVFINPSLDATIEPRPMPTTAEPIETEAAHVHRVVDPRVSPAPFVFGASEWRRKGLGKWCHDVRCIAHALFEAEGSSAGV